VFERYTEKARRVVFFARYEASQFGSPYIESEHLLLGFLRESKFHSARLFPSSSFTVDTIRKQIEAHTTFRKKILTSVDLPLSEECRRILLYASEEADHLSHKHIGTEHLLLGALREKDCYATLLLNENGVTLESARAYVAGDPREELAPLPKSPGMPAGYRWKQLLYNAASETIVVEMRSPGPALGRLFMRPKDAEAYEQIGDPADDVSFEDPVTCEQQPIVIFNSMKWAGGGGNPDGVYAFNLSAKKLIVCVAKDALNIPEPHLRSWIFSLVSLSDDAQTLYLKVGIEKPVSGGGVVEYYLAGLALLDKKLELLSRLKDTRF
jgi:Clp amino terminal domain, pathogenicity island component